MTTSQPTTIDLLRHGQCEGGEIYRGHTDVPLSQEGWAQMQASLAHLPSPGPWQQIVSSPLKRCHHFAQQLADELDIPCHPQDKLQEMHFGNWEGQPIAEVWRTQEAKVRAFAQNPVANAPPGGETMTRFAERVNDAWQELLKAHTGQHILCISHGGTMRVIMAQAMNIPLTHIARVHVPYACLSRICIYPDRGDAPLLMFHNLKIPDPPQG